MQPTVHDDAHSHLPCIAGTQTASRDRHVRLPVSALQYLMDLIAAVGGDAGAYALAYASGSCYITDGLQKIQKSYDP